MPVSLYDSTASRFVVPGSQIDVANPVNWEHQLNVGRVAWWKRIPNPGWSGGGILRDLVRGGGRAPNDGTLTGAIGTNISWQGHKPPGGSGSLLFDGTTGCVIAARPVVIGATFTLSAWVFKTVAAGIHTVLCQGNAASSQQNYYIRINSGAGFTTATNTFKQITTPDLSLNVWHHVALTYDGAALTFWLDGVSNTTGAATGTPQFVASPATLGRLGDNALQFWQGKLDDISIWSRALTTQEIAAHYALSRQGYPGVLNRLSPATMFGPLGGGGVVSFPFVPPSQRVDVQPVDWRGYTAFSQSPYPLSSVIAAPPQPVPVKASSYELPLSSVYWWNQRPTLVAIPTLLILQRQPTQQQYTTFDAWLGHGGYTQSHYAFYPSPPSVYITQQPSQRHDPLPEFYPQYQNPRTTPIISVPAPAFVYAQSPQRYDVPADYSRYYQTTRTIPLQSAPVQQQAVVSPSQRFDSLYEISWQAWSKQTLIPPASVQSVPPRALQQLYVLPVETFYQWWEIHSCMIFPPPVVNPPPTHQGSQRSDSLYDFDYRWWEQRTRWPVPLNRPFNPPVEFVSWQGTTNVEIAWQGMTNLAITWQGQSNLAITW